MSGKAYVGRFAPSPSGPLHAGSLVAALASYLDARVHHGRWLLRIEDIDETRTVPGAADDIIATLAALDMHSDGPILVQSQRKARYQIAREHLGALAYPCGCSRKEIAVWAENNRSYPLTKMCQGMMEISTGDIPNAHRSI